MLENSFAPSGAIIQKITKGQVGIIVLAVAGVVGLRIIASRKISSAERLADGLLDTDKLNEALRNLPDASDIALASCAAYVINVAQKASEGQGVTGTLEDPLGFSRTQRHPYTNAVTTVRTESHYPDHCMTYAVSIPEIADVRGTRRVGGVRMSGLSPARPAPDTIQITLPTGYTVQVQTEFEVADYLVTGSTRLYGTATIGDSAGNVGRVHIGFDGTVTGTVTRQSRILGRFEGKVATGVTFRKYEFPSDPSQSDPSQSDPSQSDPSQMVDSHLTPNETVAPESHETTTGNGPTIESTTSQTE